MRIIRSLLAGLALTAVVVAGALPSTTAAFTDATAATGNTVSTGSLTATAVDATTAQPSATSIDVAWGAASVPGSSLAPSYTVERSATADGANPTTIYTGGDTRTTDAGSVPAEAADIPFTAISAGQSHTAALAEDGSVYVWGSNRYGQLGVTYQEVDVSSVPRRMGADRFGGQRITAIAAGHFHTVALAEDGTLYAWGRNSQGQLGDGGTYNSPEPTQIGASRFGRQKIAAIAAGGYHTVALTAAGNVYAWGGNAEGQLGTGSASNPVSIPRLVQAERFGGQEIAAVAAGATHTAAVTKNGGVYTWGDNSVGQLGDGSTEDSAVPVPAGAAELDGKRITAVAAGFFHTAAVTDDGSLYTWGHNTSGQLGDGTNTNSPVPVLVERDLLGGGSVVAVAAGRSHTIVAAGGAVYSWGLNVMGQLGDETAGGSSLSPVRIGAERFDTHEVVALTAGEYHSFALAGGAAYGWGSGYQGRLGNGTEESSGTPKRVVVTGDPACAAGATTLADGSCSLAPDTAYYYRVTYTLGNWSAPASAWTPLTTGLAALTPSLADGATSTSTSLNVTWPATSTPSTYTLERSASADGADPTTVYSGGHTTATDTGNIPAEVAAIPFVSVAAGELHTIALTTDGEVYTWGNNWRGQLGNGTIYASSTPVKVAPELFDGHKITAVAAGEYHSVALADDGAVWAWGYGTRGQLGDGNVLDRELPVHVEAGRFGGQKITAIAAGGEHTVALTENGQLYTWGGGGEGQLGTGNSSPIPENVDSAYFGGRRITAIAAGHAHTVVVTEGGAVFAWGSGTRGEIGNGGFADQWFPVPVDMTPFAGQKVVALAAGEGHTVALTEAGAVYAWGDNGNGQLGDGTALNRAVPTPVDASWFGGKTIGAIAAGERHTLAVTQDGTVFAWGRNDHVQLGHNALFVSLLPAAVNVSELGGRKVIGVAGGQSHTVAVTEDGAVFTWGDNAHGQLGNGTTEPEGVPTAFSAPTRVFCAEGAVLTGDRCSLTPDTTYYYRVSYTHGDRTGPASAWVPLRTLEP